MVALPCILHPRRKEGRKSGVNLVQKKRRDWSRWLRAEHTHPTELQAQRHSGLAGGHMDGLQEIVRSANAHRGTSAYAQADPQL